MGILGKLGVVNCVINWFIIKRCAGYESAIVAVHRREVG